MSFLSAPQALIPYHKNESITNHFLLKQLSNKLQSSLWNLLFIPEILQQMEVHVRCFLSLLWKFCHLQGNTDSLGFCYLWNSRFGIQEFPHQGFQSQVARFQIYEACTLFHDWKGEDSRLLKPNIVLL